MGGMSLMRLFASCARKISKFYLNGFGQVRSSFILWGPRAYRVCNCRDDKTSDMPDLSTGVGPYQMLQIYQIVHRANLLPREFSEGLGGRRSCDESAIMTAIHHQRE